MSDPIPVETMDPEQKNSPVSGPIEQESTVMLSQANTGCHWNGTEYPEGAIVESAGKCYECSYGKWVERG